MRWLLAACALAGLPGCDSGRSGAASAYLNQGCKALDDSPKTMADIDKIAEGWKTSRVEKDMVLTKGTCGAYETASASNGHASFRWYLKDGAVVAESYSDDNQGSWCKGTVPACE
jgi:hypothetical protein